MNIRSAMYKRHRFPPEVILPLGYKVPLRLGIVLRPHKSCTHGKNTSREVTMLAVKFSRQFLIPVSAVFHHGIQDSELLAHASNDCHFFGFAGSD
jgi:hypothetical protein